MRRFAKNIPYLSLKRPNTKTQMTYPRPTTRGPMACNPLGRTDVIWGSGREFPYKGGRFWLFNLEETELLRALVLSFFSIFFQ